MCNRQPSFQVLSDVHLEHRPRSPLPAAAADYLILAGDIGETNSRAGYPVYKAFLAACSQQFPGGVFLVAGNHESYGGSIQKTLNDLQALCSVSCGALGACS